MLIRFCSYAAGEFEDEAVFFFIEDLAKAESRPFEDVEKELKDKLEFRENKDDKQHPYEIWGPQELADRINKAQAARE